MKAVLSFDFDKVWYKTVGASTAIGALVGYHSTPLLGLFVGGYFYMVNKRLIYVVLDGVDISVPENN